VCVLQGFARPIALAFTEVRHVIVRGNWDREWIVCAPGNVMQVYGCPAFALAVTTDAK
jgi:hypothetical protein